MKLLIVLVIPLIALISCVQPTAPEGGAVENSDPVINKITVDPPYISVGTTTTITVDASDPDGDNLSYHWSVALGDILGSGYQVRYTAAFCCVGVNTINVEVRDSKGAITRGTINLEINP
jgi:hypothetical protein